jgi:peptidyl-tRNA hydrolase, PTH1 family
MALDRLAERFGARLKKVRFLNVSAAEANHEGIPLILVAPATFMNLSGPPTAGFAKKRGVTVDRVIALHDEIDLPFASLRVKRGGSTAGHHGLDSLVQAFRSPDFYRIRMGVGRPPGRQNPVDFVLHEFTPRERDDVDEMIERAADAALSLVVDGLAVTQDRYNRGVARPES